VKRGKGDGRPVNQRLRENLKNDGMSEERGERNGPGKAKDY